MFGGDGENRADPQEVEVIWPGYDDGFDDSGYVTMGHFDPIPKIPEQSYGSFWYSGAVLLNDTMIMTCGGGYPATNKCFGLDLVSGTWTSLSSMNHPRTETPNMLVKVQNTVLAVGGATPGSAQIEIYNADFNTWFSMAQWNGPLVEDFYGCAVAFGSKIMVTGNEISSIFDLTTQEWKETAANPNPRSLHGCLHTIINGTEGVMLTGGSDWLTDPNDYYPGSVADFYQLETDTWISLANSSFPQSWHQMVLYEDKPTIIGGEYEMFEREVEVDGYHKRDHVQVYNPDTDRWFCCLPTMSYKRSKFAAVKVGLSDNF